MPLRCRLGKALQMAVGSALWFNESLRRSGLPAVVSLDESRAVKSLFKHEKALSHLFHLTPSSPMKRAKGKADWIRSAVVSLCRFGCVSDSSTATPYHLTKWVQEHLSVLSNSDYLQTERLARTGHKILPQPFFCILSLAPIIASAGSN